MGMADMQKLTQVETTEGAFAALTDGKVVTWGSAVLGGDSSTVQEELVDIQKIWSTQGAFAAKRADGKIITWGDAKAGGECHRVRDQLGEVVEIYSAHVAFAAVVGVHRPLVTWGSPEASECHVQDRLYGVREICGTYAAFAAILDDGTLVTWGDVRCGGDSDAIQDQLLGVKGSLGAFAAILEDGRCSVGRC